MTKDLSQKIDNFTAFDICGPAGASQAIGCLLGLCSIPLTFGPQIAGDLSFIGAQKIREKLEL